MDVTIRQALITDSEAIVSLIERVKKRSYMPILSDYAYSAMLNDLGNRATQVALWRERIGSGTIEPTRQRVSVVEYDGMVRGIFRVVCKRHTVFISNFYIDTDTQGQGLGSMLLKDLFDGSKGRTISLEVLEHNAAAIGFYKHAGFTMHGPAEHTYFGEPKVVMKHA